MAPRYHLGQGPDEAVRPEGVGRDGRYCTHFDGDTVCGTTPATRVLRNGQFVGGAACDKHLVEDFVDSDGSTGHDLTKPPSECPTCVIVNAARRRLDVAEGVGKPQIGIIVDRDYVPSGEPFNADICCTHGYGTVDKCGRKPATEIHYGDDRSWDGSALCAEHLAEAFPETAVEAQLKLDPDGDDDPSTLVRRAWRTSGWVCTVVVDGEECGASPAYEMLRVPDGVTSAGMCAKHWEQFHDQLHVSDSLYKGDLHEAVKVAAYDGTDLGKFARKAWNTSWNCNIRVNGKSPHEAGRHPSWQLRTVGKPADWTGAGMCQECYEAYGHLLHDEDKGYEPALGEPGYASPTTIIDELTDAVLKKAVVAAESKMLYGTSKPRPTMDGYRERIKEAAEAERDKARTAEKVERLRATSPDPHPTPDGTWRLLDPDDGALDDDIECTFMVYDDDTCGVAPAVWVIQDGKRDNDQALCEVHLARCGIELP